MLCGRILGESGGGGLWWFGGRVFGEVRRVLGLVLV